MKHTNNRLAEMIKKQGLKLGFGVAMGALFTGGAIGLSHGSAQAATIHDVQAGETLSGIGAQYGVDWHDLAASNGLSNPDLIFPGQQISIDGGSVEVSAAPAAEAAPVAETAYVPAPASNGSDLRSLARQAAADANINPGLFEAQIQQESGFNANAVSSAGAIGVAQIMPGTAAELGVNPSDPNSALHGAARLMASNLAMFGGDYAKALAAYNAGPGTVQYAVAAGGANWISLLPYETQHYIQTIMG